MFSPKRYLLFLISLFFISIAAFVYLIINVTPASASLSQFALFYLTVCALALSVFTLIGYSIRVFTSHNNPLFVFARVSLRQGFLLAVFLTILLFLQSLRAITLLSVGLLLISLTLLEIAFLSR